MPGRRSSRWAAARSANQRLVWSKAIWPFPSSEGGWAAPVARIMACGRRASKQRRAGR